MSGYPVEYYYERPAADGLPAVIVHTFTDEGAKLWEGLQESGCRGLLLAAVRIGNWEETLSPWAAPKVFRGGSDFGSGADLYITELTEKILPEIRKRGGTGPCYIAGYSFAGLFALYSLYRTAVFDGAASVSGSLWFPGFAEFAMDRPFRGKPGRLYLSLGDKESNTRNETMKTVGEKTELLYRHYKNRGIDCIYETNPGNHFQDPEKRLIKGIRWLVQ